MVMLKSWALILGLFLTHHLALGGDVDISFCPEECDCEYDDLNQFKVKCKGDFPPDRWHKIPNNTVVLEMKEISDLSSLPYAAFEGLNSLKSLTIKDCPLEQLEDGCFEGIPQLKMLKLKDDRLYEIPDNIFSNLSKLEELTISDNMVNQLNSSSFYGLDQLKILDLSHNEINFLPCRFLEHLGRIEQIQLGNNRITTLFGCEFTNSEYLNKIEISNNNLRTISQGSFKNLASLNSLGLSYNRIVKMEEGSLNDVPSLSVLSLEGNSFTKVPTDALKHAGSLKKLILTANPIDILRKGSFQGLSNLHELYMRRMYQMYAVSSGAFDGLENIEIIALEDNPKLGMLSINLFPEALHNLHSLFLSNNEIQTFFESTFAKLPLLRHLGIENNPLRCDCNAIWINRAIYFGNYTWSKAWRKDTPVCHLPLNFDHKIITMLDPEEMECQDSNITAETSTHQVVEPGENVKFQVSMKDALQGHVRTFWLSPKGSIIRNRVLNRRFRIQNRFEIEKGLDSILTITDVDPSVGGRYAFVAEEDDGQTSYMHFYLVIGQPSSSVERNYLHAEGASLNSSGSSSLSVVLLSLFGVSLLGAVVGLAAFKIMRKQNAYEII